MSSTGGTGGSASNGGRGGNGGGSGSPGSGGKAGPLAGRDGTGEGGEGAGGAAGGTGGPPGGGSGGSPYEIECHGDTLMCGDPTSLLCLGIRVETEVFGYSCSHVCASDADCSDVAASADAEAGCVDFVSTSYCLLVCQEGDEEASCPGGMYCYVYPGTTLGYCLWH